MNGIKDFTEGKIGIPLLKFTLPIMGMMFLQALYGGVDMIVVGQFADTIDVSAVSTGSQVMATITGIITGITTGFSIMLSRYIGEKNQDSFSKTMGASVFVSIVLALLISVVFTTCARPISMLMNAPSEALEKTANYVFVCSMGGVFITAYNLFSGLFRGMGNSKLPLIFVAVSCVVNIVGDIVLVKGFNMGALGAAVATIFAQFVSVILCLVIVCKKGYGKYFEFKNIRFHKKEALASLKVGAPIALQDVLTNVSFLIVTSIINSLGIVASASIGVCEKVAYFTFLIPFAYMTGLATFVSQNYGAGKMYRAKRAMYNAFSISTAIDIVIFFIMFFRGDLMVGIFTKDIAVITSSAQYLKAYAIDELLISLLLSYMGFFDGIGRSNFVLIQGLISAFLVRIPFSYFISKMPGVTMLQIGIASPLATTVSLILCFIYYQKNKRNIFGY